MEPYEEYVARCEAEDLTPLTFDAWDLVREPMTPRSMQTAWRTTMLWYSIVGH